jgi:hypothetical protein
MTKGSRRERQAVEIYQDAGYTAYSPENSQYGENDILGRFDLVAVKPGFRVEFVQVKSNEARGIRSMEFDLQAWFPLGHATCRYAVCHDREGWRLITVYPDGHETVYDGRTDETNMGDGLTAFLAGGVDE